MKRLVSTLNLSKEDWLRYRKCGITGTDAGAILGLNPYRSAFQVYHDKISDTIENIDNDDSAALNREFERIGQKLADMSYDEKQKVAAKLYRKGFRMEDIMDGLRKYE